jgi:DNA-binding NarL/FixJ family response regulator
LQIVAAAGSAEEAMIELQQHPADVVLMDINLPGASGIEGTRQILNIAPSAAVLIVTMVDDDDSVLAALAAGARGYVLKEASAEEIIAALRTVAAGGAVFGARIAFRLLAKSAHTRPEPTLAAAEQFTAREHEVLTLLADGTTNKDIARSLNISLKTVQNHVSHILDKLQATDRTQAVLRARGTPPPPPPPPR